MVRTRQGKCSVRDRSGRSGRVADGASGRSYITFRPRPVDDTVLKC